VGLGLSYTISFILNKVAGGFMMMGGGGDTGISVIPIWLSGAGLAFSTVVGIVSGYYPAQRAMKLSALAAIKTE
jgi:ABC-type antimicrobial peptide transport system permease subunit